MVIKINEHLTLESIAPHHASALFDLVDHNRRHLSRFLPWVVSMQSATDFTQYIHHCQQLHRQKKEVSFVIIYDSRLVGRIGIHHIHSHNKDGALGYWLAQEAQGKGIIINACKALLTLGFDQLELHRIEIKTATTNIRSQKIAEKLGFTKEGVLRQAAWVQQQVQDLVVYSLLRNEWQSVAPQE